MFTVVSISILEDLRKLDNEICIGSGYWTSERYRQAIPIGGQSWLRLSD